jgi:pimeloyl-ACP methyl ester carboxylesterase
LVAQLAAGDRRGILLAFLRDVLGYPQQLVDELAASSAWPSYEACALTLPAEVRAFESYRFAPAAFASLSVPTLVMQGSESPPFIVAATVAVAAALPNARLVVLEGQGHEAPETGPEAFARAVLGFLAR